MTVITISIGGTIQGVLVVNDDRVDDVMGRLQKAGDGLLGLSINKYKPDSLITTIEYLRGDG